MRTLLLWGAAIILESVFNWPLVVSTFTNDPKTGLYIAVLNHNDTVDAAQTSCTDM